MGELSSSQAFSQSILTSSVVSQFSPSQSQTSAEDASAKFMELLERASWIQNPEPSPETPTYLENLVSLLRSKKAVAAQIDEAQHALDVDAKIVGAGHQAVKYMNMYSEALAEGKEGIVKEGQMTSATRNIVDLLLQLKHLAMEDFAGDISSVCGDKTNACLTMPITTLARKARQDSSNAQLRLLLAATAEANSRIWSDEAANKGDRQNKSKQAARVADLATTLIGNLSSSKPDKAVVEILIGKLAYASQKYGEKAFNSMNAIPERITNLQHAESTDTDLLSFLSSS